VVFSWQVILYFYLPSFALVYLVAFFIRRRNRNDRIRVDQENMPLHALGMYPTQDTYLRLRQSVLNCKIGELNLPTPWPPGKPFAVLMDWPVSRGIATTVAVADGTASVYFSNGGGLIGGGQAHKAIRSAAVRALQVAAKLRSQMQITTEYPLPSAGLCYFYAVSDAGVFTASALEAELRTHRHVLSKLGGAMQAIITLYRILKPKGAG
jgi:hypothetical protein